MRAKSFQPFRPTKHRTGYSLSEYRAAFCLAALLLCAPPARGAVVYDFIANASTAQWESAGGAVTFPLSPWNQNLGAVSVTTTKTFEDGTSASPAAPALFTRIDNNTGQSDHFMQGTYTVNLSGATGERLRFEAVVGDENAGGQGTRMNFSLILNKGAESFVLSELETKYEGLLTYLSADLTPFKGNGSVSLTLRADMGTDGDAYNDRGMWKVARIVDYGTVVFDFVASASLGNPWNDSAGSTLTFNTQTGTGQGEASYYTGQTEDGASVTNKLFMRPDANGTTPDWVKGKFAGVIIGSSYKAAKFVGRAGFISGATSTDGARFELWRWDGAAEKLVRSHLGTVDGIMDSVTADLTPYIGSAVDYFLKVDGVGGGTGDSGVWTDAKIIGSDPEVIYDFSAAAGLDTQTYHPVDWSSGSGALTFGSGSASTGIAQSKSGNLEAGTNPQTYLLTQPNNSGGTQYIEGLYSNIFIPTNACDVRFTAQVGMEDLASGSAVFQVLIGRYGHEYEVCAATETDNGALATITANLSGYHGQEISIKLRVTPLAGAPGYQAAWVAPRILAEAPQPLFVNDYGAIPDDANDDQPAVAKAAAAANSCSPAELRFGAGLYRFSRAITMNGMANLNYRGYEFGATPTQITITSPIRGWFNISNSGNISASDFTIDYDPLPYTQGTVSNLSGNTFTFTIDAGYPEFDDSSYNLPTGFFHQAGLADEEHWGRAHEAASPYRLPNAASNWTPVAKDVNGNELWSGGNGVYSLTVVRPTGLANNGKFGFVRRSGGWLFQHYTSPTAHFSYDRVKVYACPNMVYLCTGADKLFVRNSTIQLKPGSNRMVSANGDGIHVRSCKHGPDIVNCLLENLDDDSMNIHANAYSIGQETSPTVFIVNTGTYPLNIGDTLLLFKPPTGQVGAEVKVTALTDLGGNNFNVTVSADPGTVAPGVDQFYNRDWAGDDYLVYGSTFRNTRGHGVLAQSSNGLVKLNTFSYECMHAVELTNAADWGSGLRCDDVIIENNAIDHCGYDDYFISLDRNASVRFAAQKNGAFVGDPPGTSQDMLQHNIIFRNNTLTAWARHAIFAGSVDGLTISDNVLTNPDDAAWATSSAGWMGSMFFDHCDNVLVSGHDGSETIVDQRPSGRINGKLFVLAMDKYLDIMATNNQYTTPNLSGNVPEIQAVNSYTYNSGLPLPPVANFTTTPNPAIVTAGGSVQFTDTSTNSPTSWLWDFGDSQTSTAQSPSHVYSTAGTYTVSLTATNTNGWDRKTVVNLVTVNTSTWTQLTYDEFESGWGSYTDGGGDCDRINSTTYAHQGNYSLRIRDDTNGSNFYHTNGINVNTPAYTQIKVEFWCKSNGMVSGDDFYLDYYDGSQWRTGVAHYVYNTDFFNGTFTFNTATILESQYAFPSNAKIKFRCDTVDNAHLVHIDEVRVSAQ